MKKFPPSTMQQRKKVVKDIRSGKYNADLLVECIREIQPGLAMEYLANFLNRKSYDTMYVPLDRKWFYECRNRILSLYIERMNDYGNGKNT